VADLTTQSDVSLASYAGTIWRRKLTVILGVLIAVGLMIGYDSTISPTYVATSQFNLFVRPNNTNPQVTAAMYTMNSPAVVSLVTADLGYRPPKPVITQIGNTPIMNIVVTTNDPLKAAAIANAYPRGFNKYSQQNAIVAVYAATVNINQQITAAKAQQALLATQISKLPKGSPLRIAAVSQLNSLQTQINHWTSVLNGLQGNVVHNAGNVISPAIPPRVPVSPKPTSDALLAALVGLALGIAIALLQEFLDDKIRSRSDLERVFPGFATIGMIPQIREWQDRSASFLVSAEQPKSPTAEAFRGLRTSLQFLGLDEPIKTLLVTSAAATDGKTTVAANLGYTIASAAQRVIIIGCDLRKPRVHQFFGVSNEVGFTSVLLGDSELEDAIHQVEGAENLFILPSGPIPPNPAELLAGPKARSVMRRLAEEFDLVILDSAPILPVTDALVLAGNADATVFIATAGISTRRNTGRAYEMLKQVDANVVGLVLNRAPESDSYVYYRYGYGYGYGSTPTAGKGADLPPVVAAIADGTETSD